MVCRIIDGTRDMLVSRGMSKEQANDAVLKSRQLFFDPFATPGHHPTTDPEFKKMLPLFPAVTMYLLDHFRYGAPRYDRSGAEKFSVKFVAYAREHFASGAPEMSPEEFANIAGEIAQRKGSTEFNPREYDYIQVTSWEQMKELAREYRLDTWCIAKYEEDWDKFTLRGQGKFYLLVKEGAENSDGADDVIGITVNHYGRIAAAYNRPNICVDIDAVTRLASELDLTRPFARDFSAALDLIRAGYNYEEVYPYHEEIGDGYVIVGEFDGNRKKCLLDMGRNQYVSDIFTDIDPVRDCDFLCILDGRILYDIERDRNVISTTFSRSFDIHTDGYDIDNNIFWLDSSTGNIRRINAISLDDPRPTLLIDESNRVPVDDAEFHSITKRYPTVERMADGDFWVLNTADGMRIVTKPGMKLEDCQLVPSHSEEGWNEVLTPNGYYMNVISGRSHGNTIYYLMKDGKRVFDCPFQDAGRDSRTSYDIYLITMSGDEYHFDPFTGKTVGKNLTKSTSSK